MIDATSMKIVVELCRDGRLTNIELAKRLGINTLTLAKKKTKLLNDGVIKINAVSMPRKIGYQVGAFFGLDVNINKILSVCDELVSNPNTSLVATCFGRFGILANAYFYDIEGLQNFVKWDLSQINGVNNIETYLIAEIEEAPSGFPVKEPLNEPVRLDNIDKKLINELLKEANTTHIHLARVLGISQSSVTRRIDSLVKRGVIFFRAAPDPLKLGYTSNAFVFLRSDPAKIDHVCRKLADYPEIHLILQLTSDYQILFGVLSLNPVKLYEFMMTKIASIDGVLKTETLIRGFFHHFKAASLFIPSEQH